MHNIAITTECVADLPQRLCQENEIGIIYFDIKTEGGLFQDTVEIDSQNVMEYMADGTKTAISVIPTANAYKNFFDKTLREYSEVIHICISSGISDAYNNAVLAKVKMGQDGEKVHVIDSKHLSAGQGILAMEAVKWRDEGLSGAEIVDKLDDMIPRISTSFLAKNANYLYYNGKVKKSVMDLCNVFHIHPVLAMIDGKLTLKMAFLGKYNRVARKYIKKILGDTKKIDTSIAVNAYAGCSEDILELAREKVKEKVTFENYYEQQASATVSSNCGPRTFGIIYAMKP